MTERLPEGNRATVVVPVEPTQAMLDAADDSGNAFTGSYLSSNEMTALIWSAMLSAAPPSAVGASEPVAWRRARDGWLNYQKLGQPLYTAQPLEAENRSLREALDHPLLREVLGFVEDCAPDEIMAQVRQWQDTQRAALSRFPEQEGS